MSLLINYPQTHNWLPFKYLILVGTPFRVFSLRFGYIRKDKRRFDLLLNANDEDAKSTYLSEIQPPTTPPAPTPTKKSTSARLVKLALSQTRLHSDMIVSPTSDRSKSHSAHFMKELMRGAVWFRILSVVTSGGMTRTLQASTGWL